MLAIDHQSLRLAVLFFTVIAVCSHLGLSCVGAVDFGSGEVFAPFQDPTVDVAGKVCESENTAIVREASSRYSPQVVATSS
ncbi:hypothetical protein LTS18_001646, partial [Coniosporium uncinatum]